MKLLFPYSNKFIFKVTKRLKKKNYKIFFYGYKPNNFVKSIYDLKKILNNYNNLEINNDLKIKSKNYSLFQKLFVVTSRRIFFDKKIDSVIHLAAESHVDRSISNPFKFAQTNVLGTLSLLEASRNFWNKDFKNKLFYHVSTDEVYGTIKDGEIDEEGKLFPSSPYSSSKASADLIGLSYIKTYDLNLKIIRPANNYGILQQPEKLIPFSIISLLNKRKIEPKIIKLNKDKM